MKLNKITKGLGALALTVLYISCSRSVPDLVASTNANFNNKAFVQIYNGTLTSTRNYAYVDGNALTGAAFSYGSTFPSIPSNFSVTSGLRAFLIRDTQIIKTPVTTQLPMSFAQSLDANKYYTIFMYDTLNSPQQKIVNNDIQIPTDTTARVRFANFIFSKTAVPNVDVFSVKRNANVFTNVGVTDVTGYIPFAAALTTSTSDTLLVRETGTTNLLAQLNTYLPIRKRSYTLVFRGRYQSTTGSVVRTLSSFSNN